MGRPAENIVTMLKSIRTEAQETQGDLAEQIGVSRQTIISIEKGNYVPSVALALKLAHHFDTSVEKLFVYEG